jgi:pilus assembly protein CpaE
VRAGDGRDRLGQVNDVRLYRDLLASGIQDYLLKPLNPAGARRLASAQAAFSRRQAPGRGESTHLAAAVIGTRGGVGASTVATSLAWLFRTGGPSATALLDLDCISAPAR